MKKSNKLRPICYMIYDYLKENAIGCENKKSAREIMDEFGIPKSDILREYIRDIRDDETLQKVICSKSGNLNNGYWIETDYKKAYENIINEKQRYLDGIKRCNNQLKKLKKHNQRRLKLFGKEKEIWESIEEQL